jgi:hypothetical protein
LRLMSMLLVSFSVELTIKFFEQRALLADSPDII